MLAMFNDDGGNVSFTDVETNQKWVKLEIYKPGLLTVQCQETKQIGIANLNLVNYDDIGRIHCVVYRPYFPDEN